MYDWHAILDEQAAPPVAVSRDRVRWLLVAFAVALGAILLRAVQLEVSDGANFRRLAARPIEHEVTLAPQRGRIFARDGSVLAAEGRATALAMQYRYLQQPPEADWLRRARGHDCPPPSGAIRRVSPRARSRLAPKWHRCMAVWQGFATSALSAGKPRSRASIAA